MSSKLNSGDQLPEVDLSLSESDSVLLPKDIESPYLILLFYRGHW